MEEIDFDKSGYIDRIEWLNFLECTNPKTKFSKSKLPLRQLFYQYDADKNGVLSMAELNKLFREHLKTQAEVSEFPAEQINQIIDKVFKMNTKESLDLREFENLVEQGRERIPELKKLLEASIN